MLCIAEDGLQMAAKNGHDLSTRLLRWMLAWLHEQALDPARARQLCTETLQQNWEGEFGQFLGVDSPRSGTRLTADEIETILLEWGNRGAGTRAM